MDNVIKTTYCKGCGTAFDENLEKCPNCGKRNKLPIKIIAICAAVLIVVLIVGIAIGSGGNSTPDVADKNAATSESMPLPEDSEMTLTPQETVEPTEEPSSDNGAAGEATMDYLSMVQNISQQLSDALLELGTLVNGYDGSQEWYDACYAEIDTVNRLLDQMETVDCPSEFKISHGYLMQAVGSYREGMKLFERGLTLDNAEDITSSTLAMQEGNDFMNQATQAVYDYMDDLE